MTQPTILLNTTTLKALAEAATPPASTTPCACGLHKARAWESITEDRWPAAMLEPLGTLRDPAVDEPTFEEFHPKGTRYDSADAPIAVAYFPFNRSDVFRCSNCARLVLRYTEFGGYYIDHRVRLVDAALILSV